MLVPKVVINKQFITWCLEKNTKTLLIPQRGKKSIKLNKKYLHNARFELLVFMYVFGIS